MRDIIQNRFYHVDMDQLRTGLLVQPDANRLKATLVRSFFKAQIGGEQSSARRPLNLHTPTSTEHLD
jgi:hypothetical protein